jgi:PII-like signaling protein
LTIIKNKVSGATVWTGIDSFEKRRSTLTIEGITMHIPMPMIIEVIDEKSKLEPFITSPKDVAKNYS